MGMSGKTFLSAFQMGAKMYPDIVKSREDQIDKKLKRDILDLQKNKLEIDANLAEAKKNREVIGMKSLNEFKTEYEALDMNDSRFPSQWRRLVKDNITGIGMSQRSLEEFNTIKETVVNNEIFKAKEAAEADALAALSWWNDNNPLNKVGPDSPPDAIKVVNDSYKEHLQEEKSKSIRAEVEAKGSAETALKDKAEFVAFIEETGSTYLPEDYTKPEAKDALRVHKQTKEVKDLIMEVGSEGLPIMAKLEISPDGRGYKNLLAVKAELRTLANQQKEKRERSGKDLSEAEGNALMYSERLRFANETMDQMVIEGAAPESDFINGLIAQYTGGKTFNIANALINPKYQKWKSAADNYIRATLRKESGAAIADHEYIGGFKDYIPLLGDSAELKEHKRDLRIGVADTMRRISGVPWEETYLPRKPMRFPSKEAANRYKGKWLKEGDKGEFYDKDRKMWIPFTVGKSKAAKKPETKPDLKPLPDPMVNPLLKAAPAPTSIRP
jgi:hypothetical protein